MRAIIRFSVDNEKNGALRNKLAAKLNSAGFFRGANTATYEHVGIDEHGIGNLLEDFWLTAHAHRGHGRIDHFWMYVDR